MESIVVSTPLHFPATAPATATTADLLRELLDVQRKQLAVLREQQATADDRGRWRGLHARHADDFPELPAECQEVLPVLERAYLSAVSEMTSELRDPDADMTEFRVNELLDRHVPRLGQLWSLLTQVSQLASVAPADRG